MICYRRVPAERVRVRRLDERLLALEQRVEELEVAREQERAQQTPAPSCTYDECACQIFKRERDEACAKCDEARHDLAAARQAVKDSEAQREQLSLDLNHARETRRFNVELKRQCDEWAGQINRLARYFLDSTKREILNENEYVCDAAVRVLDDRAGELRAMRLDHETLVEAHNKSCDERAKLVAELERLRAGIRTIIERAAGEIRDRKAKTNFVADFTKELGGE